MAVTSLEAAAAAAAAAADDDDDAPPALDRLLATPFYKRREGWAYETEGIRVGAGLVRCTLLHASYAFVDVSLGRATYTLTRWS